MAKPGPKPLPTAVKKLRGNPGHRPLNDDEPELPNDLPSCPDHLDKVGKKEWTRITGLLDGRGLLTEADRATLAAYCETWSIHAAAANDLHKYGTIILNAKGIAIQSPYLRVVQSSSKLLVSYAAELGLTPSSRSRVSAVKESKPSDLTARFFEPRIAKTG